MLLVSTTSCKVCGGPDTLSTATVVDEYGG